MARSNAPAERKGVSLAKGPVALIGLASLALGVLGFIFGNQSFKLGSIPSGTVNGGNFIGIEGNGWTWVLFAAAGLLLLLGSRAHWGAKSMAMIVGLVLGAASVIAIADGTDVFGILAFNGLTELVAGAGAAALLLLSLLPRVGRRKGAKQDDDRETVVERRRERVVEREPATTGTGTRRFGRDDDTVGREDTAGRDARDYRDTGGSDRAAEGRRVEREPAETTGGRRVVAPADGDGPEDRGRRRF